MRRKKKHIEIIHNENTDRYLITYADLITLLLGLFVILYVSSQVDEQKYRAFAAAFSTMFHAKGIPGVEGGGGILPGSKGLLPEPVLKSSNIKSLGDVSSDLDKVLNALKNKSGIKIKTTKSGIVLVLPENFLFASGKADIQPEGIELLSKLSAELKGLPYQITVDGHTDSDPIRTFQFESNWHLSVSRALNVGYKMIQSGVSENNMMIRGYGASRPVADNISSEGKIQNRRVEITISELPPEVPSTIGYTKPDSTKKQ